MSHPDRFKFILIFILQTAMQALMAQNMVPNPSFEELTSYPPCWTSGSREDFQLHVKQWVVPNMGTTDLLSTQVNPHCITAMPYSDADPVDYFPKGTQLPRTGDNFAGIKPFNNSRREYLEVKLACALIPGEQYYAEMYVSLSENTNYAQNNLGMYFSDTLVYTDTYEMLHFTPQILENNVISDTIHWVKISGVFTAASPSEYLIIGNFATQATTTRQFLGNKGSINFPYYFIDDVLVQQVNTPEVTVTGDTLICKGKELQLHANGWQNPQWYSSSGQLLSNGSNLSHIPSFPGYVKLQSNYCNLNLSKSIHFYFAPQPVINLGNDTLICEGTSVLLDAGPGLTQYHWKNDSTSQTLMVASPGLYSVTVQNSETCEAEDAISIGYYKKPKVDLGTDKLTCDPGGVFNVFTGQVYDKYAWNDNSTLENLPYSSEGIYWVSVTNICGAETSDTIEVTKIDPYIPNLITSNGDGKNDAFEILDIESKKGKLWVFNRHGAQVYQNDTYQNEFTGEELTEGIYYYQFSYPTCPDIKGWLQILK